MTLWPSLPGRTEARVAATRDVLVAATLEQTLAIVRQIELLEPLERKARTVAVRPSGPTDGSYTITGRIARLVPWLGAFSYAQHEAGWHSEDLHARADGWQVSGGFLVSRVDDRTTRVMHYEDYVLPPRLAPLRPLFAAYVWRSQVGEMRDLASLVHARVCPEEGREALPSRRETARLCNIEP